LVASAGGLEVSRTVGERALRGELSPAGRGWAGELRSVPGARGALAGEQPRRLSATVTAAEGGYRLTWTDELRRAKRSGPRQAEPADRPHRPQVYSRQSTTRSARRVRPDASGSN